jgi:hypothetical protein
MNRREDFVIQKIDRDAVKAAERGRLLGEAQAVVDGFLAPFQLANERAEAADALARALTPVLTALCGSVGAATRLSALSGRAAPPLPRTRGGRKW